MRPQKPRRIKCLPGERCFRPKGRRPGKLEHVMVTLDEFEAIRLADLEELTHSQAARLMKVSRPTFTRILSSAHKKVAEGLVRIKGIKIEGGCCSIQTG